MSDFAATLGNSAPLIALLVFVILAVVVLRAAVIVVPQGYEWTVERFGRYTATLKPGLHVIVPFFDQIGRRLNVQESVIEIPSQLVITKDNATVTVDGLVFYTILDVKSAAYEARNLEQSLVALTLTNIRTAIGGMDLDETLSKRDEINTQLLRVLDQATHVWGTKVTRVELKDVSPPQDVVAAMAKQLTAERNKRATILEAEGIKQGQVLKAEGEKQSQILAAEARLEAAKLDAAPRERHSTPEAPPTRVIPVAIASGDVQARNYFAPTKYSHSLARLP